MLPVSAAASTSSRTEPGIEYMHNKSSYGNQIYSRKVVDGGKTWLQYWFFYYYDIVPGALQIGDHEGDWEMMQIGLDANQAPQVVTFAAHKDNEAISCPWGAVEKTISGGDYVPRVYAAQGTHASYPHAGTWARGTALPDDNAGGQVAVRPTMIYGVLAPGVGWVNWRGSWGNSHAAGDLEQNSPHGPMYQSGPKWNQPATFDANARSCSTVGPKATAAQATGAPAHRPRPLTTHSLPAARLSARRVGSQVAIRYRFDRLRASARRRPTALLLSVDPKGARAQPRTYTYRLHRQVGVVRQTMPLGRGPFRVRAVAITADGRRGPTSTVRLR